MEMKKYYKSIGCIIQKIIGYALLVPAVLSVFSFILYQCGIYSYRITIIEWPGKGNTYYLPELPIFFGLMAIAGAYLIKDSKK